eukprot:3005817-Amphidinium_carterae.1
MKSLTLAQYWAEACHLLADMNARREDPDATAYNTLCSNEAPRFRKQSRHPKSLKNVGFEYPSEGKTIMTALIATTLN